MLPWFVDLLRRGATPFFESRLGPGAVAILETLHQRLGITSSPGSGVAVLPVVAVEGDLEPLDGLANLLGLVLGLGAVEVALVFVVRIRDVVQKPRSLSLTGGNASGSSTQASSLSASCASSSTSTWISWHSLAALETLAQNH